MTYRVRSFMAFKPDELGHDLNHRIVCSNDPRIVHMYAYWDGKQSSYWEFSFSMHKKINFYFLSVKIGFFCERSTKNTLQN
jgi:hypothetical protein